MKFEQFQQLIDCIEKDVRCPQCHKNLKKKNSVDILSARLNDIHLSVECPHCGVNVEMMAQLEELKKSSVTTSQEKLSMQSIKNISDALKNFKGKKVEDLF